MDMATHHPLPPSVKGLRKRLNLTSTQFIERYGLPMSTLNSWETTARRPSAAAALLVRLIEQYPEEIANMVKRLK